MALASCLAQWSASVMTSEMVMNLVVNLPWCSTSLEEWSNSEATAVLSKNHRFLCLPLAETNSATWRTLSSVRSITVSKSADTLK